VIRLAKFLQLFGLLVLPAALVIGCSGVSHGGEMEFGVMAVGALVFAIGRQVEKKVPR